MKNSKLNALFQTNYEGTIINTKELKKKIRDMGNHLE